MDEDIDPGLLDRIHGILLKIDKLFITSYRLILLSFRPAIKPNSTFIELYFRDYTFFSNILQSFCGLVYYKTFYQILVKDYLFSPSRHKESYSTCNGYHSSIHKHVAYSLH